jgi:hypothetical protein
LLSRYYTTCLARVVRYSCHLVVACRRSCEEARVLGSKDLTLESLVGGGGWLMVQIIYTGPTSRRAESVLSFVECVEYIKGHQLLYPGNRS